MSAERPGARRPPRPRPLSPLLAVLLLPLLVLLVTRCQWREGDSYLITRYDACVPGDAEDCEAGEDGEAGCPNQPDQWIDAAQLLGLVYGDESVAVVDVRSVEQCRANHIPRATCNPWDGEALADPIDLEDSPGWLVFYDGNGETLAGIEETLPPYCQRVVAFLGDGFGSWAALDYPIESD